MKITLESILFSQSPALFLTAIVFLISYFIRKRNHRVKAALDLILAIVAVALGIALYYLGMLNKLFTIHNFWHISVAGWVGLAIVAIISVYAIGKSIKRAISKKKAEKNASRVESAHRQELEDVRQKAYASGMADAMRIDPITDVADDAVEPPVALEAEEVSAENVTEEA